MALSVRLYLHFQYFFFLKSFLLTVISIKYFYQEQIIYAQLYDSSNHFYSIIICLHKIIWSQTNNNNNNNVDFAVPPDYRIKLKECEKKDKYLDLARELKKLWNMKVTIVPIVIGAFGTITKGLLKGLEDLEVGGRVETTQTTTLLRTARILRRVRETLGDLLSLKLQ